MFLQIRLRILIKILQAALNEMGFDCVKPDGIVGQKTLDAVAGYYQREGLTWDRTITDELIGMVETEVCQQHPLR